MRRHTRIATGATIIFILGILAIVACLLAGCSKSQTQIATNAFDKAILVMPDGEIVQGDLDSWSSWSGQIQVTIDGTTYLAHGSNIVMIAEQ